MFQRNTNERGGGDPVGRRGDGGDVLRELGELRGRAGLLVVFDQRELRRELRAIACNTIGDRARRLVVARIGRPASNAARRGERQQRVRGDPVGRRVVAQAMSDAAAGRQRLGVETIEGVERDACAPRRAPAPGPPPTARGRGARWARCRGSRRPPGGFARRARSGACARASSSRRAASVGSSASARATPSSGTARNRTLRVGSECSSPRPNRSQ